MILTIGHPRKGKTKEPVKRSVARDSAGGGMQGRTMQGRTQKIVRAGTLLSTML